MDDIKVCLFGLIVIFDACAETYFEHKGTSWLERYRFIRDSKWKAINEDEEE